MTYTAYREFELKDGKHYFAHGEARYTFTVTPGRKAVTWANASEGFAPAEDPEGDISKIEISLAPGKGYWMTADGLLWDFLREVPDAWFLEQIDADA